MKKKSKMDTLLVERIRQMLRMVNLTLDLLQGRFDVLTQHK